MQIIEKFQIARKIKVLDKRCQICENFMRIRENYGERKLFPLETLKSNVS